mgnify:CR=1 FL=1
MLQINVQNFKQIKTEYRIYMIQKREFKKWPGEFDFSLRNESTNEFIIELQNYSKKKFAF